MLQELNPAPCIRLAVMPTHIIRCARDDLILVGAAVAITIPVAIMIAIAVSVPTTPATATIFHGKIRAAAVVYPNPPAI